MEIQNISLSKDLAKLELESTAYNIRIQGIIQNKDEDIYEIIVECLAPLANYTKEEMSKELDHVFRMHTAVTKRMNTPPEVVVRFCRRCTRDRVLKASQGQKLTFQDRDIILLRDTP